MGFFTPKHVGAGLKVKNVKLSSHLVKPAKFPAGKVNVKPVRMGHGKLGKQHPVNKIKL